MSVASDPGTSTTCASTPRRVLKAAAEEVVRPARLELATFGFVVRRSIQLSYGRTSRSPGTCGSESLPQERARGGAPDGAASAARQTRARKARQYAWPASGSV